MSLGILCAAYDTPEEMKDRADFVCDEHDARPILQEAIDKAYRLGLSCILLRGTYPINSCGERSRKGAICFYNTEEPKRFYSQNKASYQVLEGAKVPLGYLDGALITVGRELYDSISDTEPFSLFYCDGGDTFGRGMMIKNLTVMLPSNQKPIIVFDGSTASSIRYEDCWVTAFDPREVDLATAQGIPMPHPRSVGFRGCRGSNFYAAEWKNLAVQGFGTGFEIGGEHIYCESLSALYNLYGFTFDCYKGRRSIEDGDDERPLGISIYPITCVNLLDEHNINMPLFGRASFGNAEREGLRKSIRIIGMNLQWPNTCPGHTDRQAPDFLTGRSRAKETSVGLWHGSIEYVIDNYAKGVNVCDAPFFEEGHGVNVSSENVCSRK